MERTARLKLKRKVKRLFWWAYIIGLGVFALNLTVLFVFVAPIEGDPTMLHMALILSAILAPLFVGLILGMYAGLGRSEIYQEVARIKKERNRWHVRMFWSKLKAGMYDEAKAMYNLSGFISHKGTWRAFCNGLIMGSVLVAGADAEWEKKIVPRMEEYLNDKDL